MLGILWQEGEVAVRDVCRKLEQTLAYTTVMTTLDRLYKKGLLVRRKQDRAYFYEARFSRLEMELDRMTLSTSTVSRRFVTRFSRIRFPTHITCR